ncbi:PadR family transcriptional regulator [Ligilactobacillus apodemi]|uniref:PadR family transcriptional regulator n=1 Tax=Ligilactobacillus apodemi DSM 16634 = JCM 16172 TaxID=1423724 RepID=A0A0R1U1R8_9LACO|nr:PadR family transcriptional regulator [Ligilactobacillus apodemi]KRL87286.1 PadR family transcriptional regulator [Ligilactobacillus apodemi DSM 16634 = JCM 16172]MCR1901783.1 PadR family transcriptional regulator [Ligilactobacillus apodemi]
MEIKVTADLLDGLVLALLERQDYYGYALTQDMQQAISISESTMYPVLRRLQKEEFVTTYDAPYHGRNRRYYKITESGEKHLERIKKMWNDYKESLDAVFAAADKRKKDVTVEEGQHG